MQGVFTVATSSRHSIIFFKDNNRNTKTSLIKFYANLTSFPHKVPKVLDTRDMIMKRALTKNVMLVPGSAFMCDNSKPSQYMRAAFSLMPPEKMDKVCVEPYE